GERQKSRRKDELQQFLRCFGSASDLRKPLPRQRPPGLSLALSRIARCLPALTRSSRLPDACTAFTSRLPAGWRSVCGVLTVPALADPDRRLPGLAERSSRGRAALWLLMRGWAATCEQLQPPAQQLPQSEAFCSSRLPTFGQLNADQRGERRDVVTARQLRLRLRPGCRFG
uniref:Secreted protein n=1 Tax=Macrostomum lignano TaxID=282301 RepID=A0A1I8FQW4_9PLAT